MIREWKDDAEIAKTAGTHAVRFLGLLRDAARAVNPDFRVITRLESFYGEHDTVWAGLGDGIDVETTSLIARGWEMPYRHPRYPDSSAINSGSVYQLEFADRERELARRPAAPRRVAGALLLLGRTAPDVRAASRRARTRG